VEFVDSDQAQLALTQQVNFANDQDLAGVAQSLEVEQDQTLAAEDSVAAGGTFSGFLPGAAPFLGRDPLAWARLRVG
jgi:hypothetical protein